MRLLLAAMAFLLLTATQAPAHPFENCDPQSIFYRGEAACTKPVQAMRMMAPAHPANQLRSTNGFVEGVTTGGFSGGDDSDNSGYSTPERTEPASTSKPSKPDHCEPGDRGRGRGGKRR